MDIEIFNAGNIIPVEKTHHVIITLTDADNSEFAEMYSVTAEEFVTVIKDYVEARRAKHLSQSDMENT